MTQADEVGPTLYKYVWVCLCVYVFVYKYTGIIYFHLNNMLRLIFPAWSEYTYWYMSITFSFFIPWLSV